jgi:hypothetical protein
VVDLANMKVLATYPVGKDPDVLAFDTGLKQLYVSAESGSVNWNQVLSVYRSDESTTPEPPTCPEAEDPESASVESTTARLRPLTT